MANLQPGDVIEADFTVREAAWTPRWLRVAVPVVAMLGETDWYHYLAQQLHALLQTRGVLEIRPSYDLVRMERIFDVLVEFPPDELIPSAVMLPPPPN